MPERLTILITNIWLDKRAGSETVVRDLALGLMRRGHRPVVYAPSLGDVADEIAARGVVVIDDLRKLAETPDILHAHHAIPCGEALIRFPQLPAIYTCHSFVFWLEAPVHFPQIAVYAAVDEACRDRLVHAEAIDPARVLMMPNVVDLARLPARPRALAQRPVRAIAFGKAAEVPELRLACEQLGIGFETIGYAGDQASAEPEKKLVQADLVFGSARCALEALCCGTAVIACDQRGMAGLVTTDNYDLLRARNFGLRSLDAPVTIERCVEEIRRYDPADALRVAARARGEAGLETRLDELERLYVDILAGSRRPTITPAAHEQAVARFLHDYLPRRPADPRWPWLGLREEMLREIESLESRFHDHRAASDTMRQEFETRLAAVAGHAAQMEAERDAARRALQAGLATSAEDVARLQHELAEFKQSGPSKIRRLLRRMTGRADCA